MATFSGAIQVSGRVFLSDPYVNTSSSKVFFDSYLINPSGKILESSVYVNNNYSKVFSDSYLIGSSGRVLESSNYISTSFAKTFTNSIIITPVGRSGLATDSGILIVNGFYTDFSATPRNALTDESIQFSNYTYGPLVDTWYWEFGDGGTSTDPNPSYSYTVAGIYSVRLTVTSVGGEEAIEYKRAYITITSLPDGNKKLYPVAANQRVTAYKAGSADKIQIKFQLYSDIKTKLSYLEGATVTLKLNYNGSWRSYEVNETDKFGGYIFYHSCENINVNNCLGYILVNINNEIYKSNLIRINFI